MGEGVGEGVGDGDLIGVAAAGAGAGVVSLTDMEAVAAARTSAGDSATEGAGASLVFNSSRCERVES